MNRIRTTLAAAAVTAASIGGLAAATALSAPASANTGYDVCVQAGTPVETGPGGSVIYTMTADQAWHVYTESDNQWTDGYISRTDPNVRGWVWGGHFDTSRTPTHPPSGGAAC